MNRVVVPLCVALLLGILPSACGSDDPPADGSFGASCTKNEDCDTKLCFDFNAKGKRCTQPCKAGSDCPDANLGCNGMGVCKVE